MNLSFNREGQTLIIFLEGEIDHHSSKSIRESIDRERSKAKIKNIIFDFSKLSFMDSSGIGMVIGRYKECQKQDGKVFIVGQNENIEKIFELSGIYKIIEKKESIKEALKSL